ncbi:MAG: hypothetical protein WCK98_07915 [bacterium]
MSSTTLNPLNFTITINAHVETVWHKMLDLESYKIWTSVFEPGSFYEGSWDLGNEISFKSGRPGGLAGTITKNEHLKIIEISYKGMFNDEGLIEDSTKEAKAMKGLVERYTFTTITENQTQLDVYTESLESFSVFMSEQWPIALEKLKEICEQ